MPMVHCEPRTDALPIHRIARQPSGRIDRATRDGDAFNERIKRIAENANICAVIGVFLVGIGGEVRPCGALRYGCAEKADQCRGHQAANGALRWGALRAVGAGGA